MSPVFWYLLLFFSSKLAVYPDWTSFFIQLDFYLFCQPFLTPLTFSLPITPLQKTSKSKSNHLPSPFRKPYCRMPLETGTQLGVLDPLKPRGVSTVSQVLTKHDLPKDLLLVFLRLSMRATSFLPPPPSPPFYTLIRFTHHSSLGRQSRDFQLPALHLETSFHCSLFISE